MYLGIQERTVNIYVDKSIRSGIRYLQLHIYTCDKCGAEHAIRFAADEPFFCSANPECVNHLVPIDPAPEAQPC